MIFVTKARCDLLCHYDVRPIPKKKDADPARRREDAHGAHRFARDGRRRGVRPRASRLLGQGPRLSASPASATASAPTTTPKIYRALHARIPMVTPDEQRAIQEENANGGDERFWEAMRDVGVFDHRSATRR